MRAFSLVRRDLRASIHCSRVASCAGCKALGEGRERGGCGLRMAYFEHFERRLKIDL